MAEQQISRFDSRRLIDNREMRIFLSSTFSDMQQEREALIKTFQSLKIEAIRRNVTLSVLDLRWGVTDDEARSGKVLSVCLEEIEHSHPFFIGLLGSCYGSSPDISVLEKNPELEERYPWIREDIENGLSYTEIEVQYGALRNDHDVDALFFVKNTADREADDNEKLTRLKQQINEQDRFGKYGYTSIDDLCQNVERSVLNILDKHFPDKASTRLEHERTVQKSYINNRHGHYQKPMADLKRLDDFLDGDDAHLVITGLSGMGKSALIANWLKEKESIPQSRNIIYHFVGNSFSGSDHRQILQHICDELYNLYGIERNEGLSEKLEDETQRILVEASQKGKPVLIVIDGINQIADHDHSKLLNWLPQAPHFAKYLFSTLDGDETMETFKRRGYPVHRIGTLDLASRREFIINYLRYVGKKLDDSQIDRILADPENENMLVLKTLLDELICFGVRSRLEERIDYYLSSSSINDFFDRMLQRMEGDYKEVRRMLSLIAVSENGMTEDELLSITGLRPLDVHLFYCAIYNHLVTRDGLITFGHQYVTDAVWRRYGLDDPKKARSYRQQIIGHVSSSDSILRSRQISELAFQYYHTGNNENLYKTILSFEAFRNFNASDKGDATLALYWRKLLENAPEKYQLQDYLELPTDGIPVKELPYLEIGQFAQFYCGDNATAFMYCQSFLFSTLDSGASDTVDIALSCNNIGTIYDDEGNYEGALGYYSKAQEVYEKVLGNNHTSTAATYGNIGTAYRGLGYYEMALEYYNKDLTISETLLGLNHPSIAATYNNIGMVFNDLGDYHHALDCFFKAQQIWENTLGLDHPNTATTYNNIAGTFYSLDSFTSALEYYKKDLAICEKVLGTNHIATATTYNNIGNVYCDIEEYQQAFIYCFKALEICEGLSDTANLLKSSTYNNIGTIYYNQGDSSNALEYFLKALEIKEKLLGSKHHENATLYNNIGMIYDDQMMYEKALEYYLKAIAIVTEVLGEDHPYTATIYNNIGMVYFSQAKESARIDLLALVFKNISKALNIKEKVLGEDHLSTAMSYNNLGSVYYYQGDYTQALEFYNKALKIREEKLGKDHKDTKLVKDSIEECRKMMGCDS